MARTLTLKRSTPPTITESDRRDLVADGERAEQRVKDIVYLDQQIRRRISGTTAEHTAGGD